MESLWPAMRLSPAGQRRTQVRRKDHARRLAGQKARAWTAWSCSIPGCAGGRATSSAWYRSIASPHRASTWPGSRRHTWQRQRPSPPAKLAWQSASVTKVGESQTEVKGVYSSSRLVTLRLSEVVFPTGDRFQWSEVGKRLVWSDVVVNFLPVSQLTVQSGHLIGLRMHLVELFVVSAVGTFHVAVQLG